MEEQKKARPIIIHHHLIQKFMRYGKDYSNLIALSSDTFTPISVEHRHLWCVNRS